MKRTITLRVDVDLLEHLDQWLADQPVRPSRNATIEAAIREWLAERAIESAKKFLTR